MRTWRLGILPLAGVFTCLACASSSALPADTLGAKRAAPGLRIVHNPAAVQREQDNLDRDREERRHAEQARLEENRRAEQQRIARADNIGWVDARRDECERAMTLDACRRVELYLANFPQGIHAGEAAQVLESSKPKLLRLQQGEVDWVKADPLSCERAPSAATCVSVCSYLGRYAGGLHAADARVLLEAAGMNPQECL